MGVGMSGAWSVEMLERGRELWDAGRSAREIGKALGVTRSAVCGMAHRRGWRAREAGRRRLEAVEASWGTASVRTIARQLNAPAGLVERMAAQIWREQEVPVAPVPAAVQQAGFGLLELGPTQCRWPIGDLVGASQLFCGAEQVAEGVYCAEHGRRAYAGLGKAVR